MNLTVNIYKSVDAFLYLPVYIAKELGIFDAILKKHHLGHVNVELPDSDIGGTDISAIQKMLIENHTKNDEGFAISIADPMAFLTKQIEGDSEEYDTNCCVVIGSLISKLPFWAVNHKLKTYSRWEDLSAEYNQVIHYEKNLITGYALGEKIVRKNSSRCKSITTNFGSEIQLCEVENKKNRKNNSRSVAITADIVSLVKSVNRENNPLRINYSFSKIDYLSTGIITTKKIAEDTRYTQILIDIIEGIQKAILLVYSSEKIAKQIAGEVATKINTGIIKEKIKGKIFPDDPASLIRLLKEEICIKEEKPNSEDSKISLGLKNKILKELTFPEEKWEKNLHDFIFPKDIDYILKLMKVEEFYPADLNIKKEVWDKTLEDLSNSVELRDGVKMEESYSNFVNNSFVLSSERSIAKQVGIDLSTFQTELTDIINPIQKERDELKSKIASINSSLLKISLFLTNCFRKSSKKVIRFLFTISIIALVILVSIYLYNSYNKGELLEVSSTILWNIVSSIILLFFSLLSKQRSNKNGDKNLQS